MNKLLTFFSLLLFSGSAFCLDVYTYIPKNALPLLPIVQEQQHLVFPDAPIPFYIGALIEQESCISLTHSKCWTANSELNTSREFGCGVFQITKAFNKTGGIRFDTLADLKKKYPEELEDLTWENIEERPDLQIRAGLLLTRDNYEALSSIKDPFNRMAFADSAYNGGIGNLQKSRRVCGMTKGCNPDVWFGNVETTLVQSDVAIYGTSSPKSINIEHVYQDMSVRLFKYRPYLY